MNLKYLSHYSEKPVFSKCVHLQASSCLLSSDAVDYGQLYDACIKLLMAGSCCDVTKPKLSPLV